MWLLPVICSAFFLGVYDIFKKISVSGNAVFPVMFISSATALCIMLPLMLLSHSGVIAHESLFFVPFSGTRVQCYIFIKSCIVQTSWIFAFFAMKHLPISIVSPIRATAPVWTLLGAIFLLGERLSPLQWVAVLLIFACIFAYSRVGKREEIRFSRNMWVFCIFAATLFAAVSALYDKYLLNTLKINRMEVQAWFSVYQFLLISVLTVLFYRGKRKQEEKFLWRWTIPCIGICLLFADFFYFYALSLPYALIAVISPIRRSAVIVSFLAGAVIFKEKNMMRKAIIVAGILCGVVLLYVAK
ncbi:MAG: DMT family transporter [Bacteroidales bacterium]|nr:DMT family transporter [Bacteroidales bacterium]